MKNTLEFNIIKKKLKNYFEKREEIMFAFLFGSVANGKTTGISDIDIAVMLDESKIDKAKNPYGYKAELLAKLISVLSFNDIDFIVLNEAPLLLKHRIVQSGREIYTKNEKLSTQFRVKVMEQFLDLKPAVEEGERNINNYTDIIRQLGETGIIPGEFAKSIEGMAGLRNILVHEYVSVDLDVIADILQRRLDDFEKFISLIRKYLSK
ncbi:MAG: DUF86 domain-containing protein [candidate division WOR-3 bacterium]